MIKSAHDDKIRFHALPSVSGQAAIHPSLPKIAAPLSSLQADIPGFGKGSEGDPHGGYQASDFAP
jgi:hypothetical protein